MNAIKAALIAFYAEAMKAIAPSEAALKACSSTDRAKYHSYAREQDLLTTAPTSFVEGLKDFLESTNSNTLENILGRPDGIDLVHQGFNVYAEGIEE